MAVKLNLTLCEIQETLLFDSPANIYNNSVVQKYFANYLISYIQFFFTVLCEKIQLVSKSVILLSIKCQVKEIKFFDIIGGMPLLAVTAAKKVLTI